VLQTRDALLGYSVGLLGLVLVKILAPGFYARQMMKIPVRIAIGTVLFAQTLAFILMHRIGHAGLTLATSLGACLNAGLLYWGLRRRGIYRPRPGWLQFVARLVVALGVLAGVLFAAAGTPADWIGASLGVRVVRLALVCGGGAAAYFAALWLLGFRLADFSRREGPRVAAGEA